MMKKTFFFLVMACVFSSQKMHAQFSIAEVIAGGITKVIRAVDLRIQRLQNKTIWLQNAQKTLENEMSKWKLEEIRDWVEKQRKLYDDYFRELWEVKNALASYNRVRIIIAHQLQLVNEYRAAWNLFQNDSHFTADEKEAMQETYSGILRESAKNIDGLFLVVEAFRMQMNDARRLELMNNIADAVEQNLMDLKQYTGQNKLVAIQRATMKGELEYVKRLHGL